MQAIFSSFFTTNVHLRIPVIVIGHSGHVDRNTQARYKSDIYPPIRSFAHAVSIDEKRDKFRPILLCPAIYPSDTSLRPSWTEKWFPGDHADVGGGYPDEEFNLPEEFYLPNISLNWMIDELAQKYSFPSKPISLPTNPNGLAHWSIGDMASILRMDCEDRLIPTSDAQHESLSHRVGQPLIRVQGKKKNFPYPIQCVNQQQLIDAP